ncbi:MAG: TIGR02186 family protein [Alphaproteobacteria bacterium]
MMFLPMGQAGAASLATDLSEDEIAITSSFAGTSLLLFGSMGTTAPQDGLDVVVVVHGPEQPMTIYRKQRTAGVWINSQPVKFDNVPGYYAVVANRPLDEIASAQHLRRENIGPQNLVLISRAETSVDELRELSRAITDNRADEGLYIIDEQAVKFPAGNLFRTNINFPASVPVGDYRVIVRLFKDGNEVDRSTKVLTVGKRGLEQWIYAFAHQQSLAYGLVAIALAVFFGWFASVIFRQR